jgi:hypothetical protein
LAVYMGLTPYLIEGAVAWVGHCSGGDRCLTDEWEQPPRAGRSVQTIVLCRKQEVVWREDATRVFGTQCAGIVLADITWLLCRKADYSVKYCVGWCRLQLQTMQVGPHQCTIC